MFLHLGKGEGGLPIKKRQGGSLESLIGTPERYHKSVFWVWLEILIIPMSLYKVPILKQHTISVILFLLSTLQHSKNSFHCGRFEPEHLRGHQAEFFP